jgi:hypothetical protein
MKPSLPSHLILAAHLTFFLPGPVPVWPCHFLPPTSHVRTHQEPSIHGCTARWDARPRSYLLYNSPCNPSGHVPFFSLQRRRPVASLISVSRFFSTTAPVSSRDPRVFRSLSFRWDHDLIPFLLVSLACYNWRFASGLVHPPWKWLCSVTDASSRGCAARLLVCTLPCPERELDLTNCSHAASPACAASSWTTRTCCHIPANLSLMPARPDASKLTPDAFPFILKAPCSASSDAKHAGRSGGSRK